VTVSARSVIDSSGSELKPAILELQAILVVIAEKEMIPSMPKPTK
jgi:hypothetical protein